MAKLPRFKIPGYNYGWERAWEGSEQWSLHIEIGDGDEHFVLWCYDGHPQYLAVTYFKDKFTGPEEEKWLDPMEAMCLALEKAKQAKASRKPSSA